MLRYLKQTKKKRSQERVTNPSPLIQNLLPEYDFIVIGSGSAGAVVASRLTENSQWKVLLLEAGDDETIVSDIPGMAKFLQLTNVDWQYQTEPQPGQCLGLKDGR